MLVCTSCQATVPCSLPQSRRQAPVERVKRPIIPLVKTGKNTSSNGRQEVILDSITDGVFTVDRHWRVTSFNRAAERITGVPREQAIGRRCSDVFRASICESACSLRQTLGRCRIRTTHGRP